MTHPARSTLEPPDYDGHFVMIELTKGKFAIADEADAELVLNEGAWIATRNRDGRTWYTQRRGRTPRGSLSMHRLIGGRKWLDHVNGNGLDNRRINLRPATRAQNNANRRLPRNNTSGYKGVSWHKGSRKWRAAISIQGRTKYIGAFDDPVEAARAYNCVALEAQGEFARLNPVLAQCAAQPALIISLSVDG